MLSSYLEGSSHPSPEEDEGLHLMALLGWGGGRGCRTCLFALLLQDLAGCPIFGLEAFSILRVANMLTLCPHDILSFNCPTLNSLRSYMSFFPVTQGTGQEQSLAFESLVLQGWYPILTKWILK